VDRHRGAAFVGRARELAALDDVRREVVHGAAHTVLLHGEAGIGKSRLVEQFAVRVRADGGRVLVGGCLQMSGLPYAAVTEALHGLVEELGVDHLRQLLGAQARDLRPLVPELGLPVGDGGTDATEATGQARTFAALLRLLERLASDRHVVLVLEDVHWADPSTRDLLVYLARTLRRHTVMVVATHRSDEVHRGHPLRPVLTELARDPRVTRVAVTPFTREELEAKLESLLASPPRRELVTRVFERSHGNPFFVEELLAAGDPDASSLPDTLLDVLLATIDDLPASTQRALRVVAAAGREVHHELLARVLPASPAELADALRHAVDRDVLVADPARGTYAFRHALFTEAVSTTVLPGEREELHARLADVLTAHPHLAATAPAAELAHHWHVAGHQARSLTASLEAAREAESLHAIAEARHHVERMAALWPRVDDAADRTGLDHVALLCWLADLAHLSGAARRAVKVLDRAIAIHDPEDDQVRHGLMHERLARYRQSLGDDPGMLAAAEQALALVPPDPSSARARVLTVHAHALWETDASRSLTSADAAASMASDIDDRPVEASALTLLGSALAATGRLDEGVASLRRARTIAEAEDLPEVIARSYVLLPAVLIRGGRLQEGAEDALAGLERVRDLGVAGGWASNIAGNATSGLFLAGRWDEAGRLVAEAVGDSYGVGWLYLLQARLLAHRGDVPAARAALADACRFAGDRDPRYPTVVLSIALLAGDLDEAHRLVLARHEHAVPAHAGTVNEHRAMALRVQADRVRAGTAVEEVADLADALLAETTDVRGAGIAYATTWQRTAAAEHARLVGPAPDAWRDAVAGWEAAGQPYHEACARFRLAEALAESAEAGGGEVGGGEVGDAEAATQLRAAHAIADRLGAAPLGRDVELLARRLAVSLPSTTTPREARPGDQPYGLTPRESEVLDLVARGRTNRQIGEALFVTEKTASVHVSNILRKLDVRARTEAAAVAFREGLVDI
jgi:DNA-binding CsgD family transcriptional regulator/tetratricopeptide (TPR) repeat protein